MAITATRYGNVGAKFAGASINYLSDTIKVALCTSAYTVNLDTHIFFSSITNQLPTANGYTSGGATLGTKSLSYISADKRTALLAADTSWTPGAGQQLTARYAIVYKDTGVAGTSPLMVYVDFGADQTADSAPFLIDWNNTGGVLQL